MFFKDEKEEPTDIGIIGRINNERTIKYIKAKYIRYHQNLDKWKVIIPSSNGSGAFGEVFSTPMIGHNQTFISIGSFDTEEEANNLMKYIKTKFARAMFGLSKVTQTSSGKDVWSNVPLQNFGSNSDIHWENSIDDINHQLYDKYELSNDIREYIDSHVKEME